LVSFTFAHSRRAILFRSGAMMPEPTTRQSPRICDCLRFGAAPTGAVFRCRGRLECIHGQGAEPSWVPAPCPFQGADRKLKAGRQNDAIDPFRKSA
jgi:hypothetical protein